MTSHRLAFNLCSGKKLALVAMGVAALTGVRLFGLADAQQIRAQSSATDWEKTAGGKMSFEVASVKRDRGAYSADTVHTNVDLGAGDAFSPTGGFFSSANYPLSAYVTFAYKLTVTQIGEILDQLPKWNNINRYDIEARAAGNPTKDQFRLMMQTLLADRFELAIHYETKQVPVLALELDRPGRLGPMLRRHSTDVPCRNSAPVGGGVVLSVAGGFPEPCGAFEQLPASAQGRYTGGARNVSMSMIASTFSAGLFRTFKPVIDRTGLTGNYDFIIDFSPELPTVQSDPNGPTFLEALKDQLGLTLKTETGPAQVFVIDHIEEPSEN